MASYNRAKLVRLLEQKRAVGVAMRDISGRLEHGRSEIARFCNAIRTNSRSYGSPIEAERLLDLPLDKALALSQEDVEGYEDANKKGRWKTGVDFPTWQRYLNAREKVARLTAETERLSARFNEEFAIVAPLCEAVRGWGFINPEQEI